MRKVIGLCVLSVAACLPRNFHDNISEAQAVKTSSLPARKHNFGINFSPVTDQVVADFLASPADPNSLTARLKSQQTAMTTEVKKRLPLYFSAVNNWLRNICATYDYSTAKFTDYRRTLDKFEHGEVISKYDQKTWTQFEKEQPVLAKQANCPLSGAGSAAPDPKVWIDPSAKMEPYFGPVDGDGFAVSLPNKQGIRESYTPIALRYQGKLFPSKGVGGHGAPMNVTVIYHGDYIFPLKSYQIGKTTYIPVAKFNSKNELIAVYDLGEIFLRSIAKESILTRLVTSVEANVWKSKNFEELDSPSRRPLLDKYINWRDLTLSTNHTYDRLPAGAIHFMVNSAWFGGMDWAKDNVGEYSNMIIANVKRDELLALYKENQLWINTYDSRVGSDFTDTMVETPPTTHQAELGKDLPNIAKAANIPDHFLYSMELILGGAQGRKFATSIQNTRIVPVVLPKE